jgi:predicted transcriptional regulator
MFIWSMSFEQLVAWLRAELKEQNISHQKLSDLSGVPKATVDGIIAGRQKDVGHYTLSAIVRVAMRRNLSASPCRSAALAAKAQEMSAKDEVIAELKASLKEAREANTTHRRTINDLRSQIKKLEASAKAQK